MPRNPILTEAERKARKAASNVRWRLRRKAEIKAMREQGRPYITATKEEADAFFYKDPYISIIENGA